MRAYTLINPASTGSLAKSEINTGTQRQTGNWNNISTYYFNASYRLTPDRKISTPETQEDSSETDDSSETEEIPPELSSVPSRYHVAGISFTGDQEGEFLNRTGVYGVYAWHTHLSKNLCLSGGISAGIKNYSVGDNYVNGGGSAFAPDGAVGVWLYKTGSHLGFSVNQIFNGKLTPIRETTRLVPYYSFTAGKNLEINRFFVLKPSLLIRAASQMPMDLNFSLGGMIQESFSATVNYKLQRGTTAMVGLEKLKLGNHYFKLMFSYYMPRGKYSYININTYEITLNYFLKPNDKTNAVF